MNLALALVLMLGLTGPVLPVAPATPGDPDDETIAYDADPGTRTVIIVYGFAWKGRPGYRDRVVLVQRIYPVADALLMIGGGIDSNEALRAAKSAIKKRPFDERIVVSPENN